MKQTGKRKCWQRILVILLCFAMTFEMVPKEESSVQVKAATTTTSNKKKAATTKTTTKSTKSTTTKATKNEEERKVYGIAYGSTESGFKRADPEVPVDYVGMQDSMELRVVDQYGQYLSGNVDYTWTAAYTPVLGVGGTSSAPTDPSAEIETYKVTGKNRAYVYKMGPGQTTITVVFKLGVDPSTQQEISQSASIVIKVPLEIDKDASRAGDPEKEADRKEYGDAFTKLVQSDPDNNNTALFFYKKDDDKQDKKYVILKNNTKAKKKSVKWESDNVDVAIVRYDSEENVVVEAKKAGIATITATAVSTVGTSSVMKDQFYVIVTTKFIDQKHLKDETGTKDLYPDGTKQYQNWDGTAIEFLSTDSLDTNAMDASLLTWKVYKEDGTEAGNLLTLEPGERISKCYIKEKPRAGAYLITMQMRPKGVLMDDDLGTARAKIKIGLEMMSEDNIVMGLNETYSLYDNTTIQDAEHFDVSFSGNEDRVVNYDTKSGKITALKMGMVVAKVKLKESKAANYGILPGTAEYTKLVLDGVDLKISVTDIFAINATQLTLKLNQVADLVVSTSSTEKIEWTSSNSSIVQITSQHNERITILGKSIGEAVITVTQKVNGVVRMAKCKVTVTKGADTITIDPSSVKMNIDDTKTLLAKVSPEGTMGQLKWLSSNESVVKIDHTTKDTAVIKGVGSGYAVITVINVDNAILATCDVTVYGKATAILLDPAKATIDISKHQLQLSASVQPSGEILPELVWNSSDTKLATVDQNGLVTLNAVGTVTITAVAKNNPEVQGTSVVTIVKEVNGIKLEATSKVMYVGEKYKLKYTITPPDAVEQGVLWTSTKPSVATVATDGTVTAVSVGETTIIAQTKDNRYTDYCTIIVKQEAEGIRLTTKDIIINRGETYQIQYTIEPPTATDIKLIWQSNNASVASVSQTGKVTGVAVGSAIIMVRTSKGESAYCNVTVQEAAKGVQLNFTEKTIYAGNTFKLRATLIPDGVTNTKVTWTTTNEKIATVSAAGTVKGIKPGTVIITCTTEEGGYEARCIVTVKQLVTTIKLNYTSYYLAYGKSLKLKATVKSTAATNPKVKWTSTNPGIVYVNQKGTITGRRYGKATITVEAQDGSGVTAKCRVEVVRPVTSIKLNKIVMTTVVGRVSKITATISPKNATYRSVTWSSSDSSVAKITQGGTLIALKAGTTTIKAAAKDSGGAKRAYCYVTVKDPVSATGVSVMTKNPVMVVGETLTMQRAIAPTNSTDRVSWASDNNTVASINSTSGKITAKSAGTATITAMTDSGKMDSTTVSVMGLNRTSLTLQQYTDYYLYVNGTNAQVIWDVENPHIATVQNGKVTSKKVGSTRIIATVGGKRLTCKLKVVKIK